MSFNEYGSVLFG